MHKTYVELEKFYCRVEVDDYHFPNSETVVRRCSVKQVFLKKFLKFTGKHLCQSLFFNKVASLRAATLSKKRLWHRGFPVNFANFLRTSFSIEHLHWLLLLIHLLFSAVWCFAACWCLVALSIHFFWLYKSWFYVIIAFG